MSTSGPQRFTDRGAPPEVWAEVDAAARLADDMAAAGVELAFAARGGRIVVEVRDALGTVLCQLSPAHALALISDLSTP